MPESVKKTGGKVGSKVKNKAKNSTQGFVDFLRSQGIVGIAIGFVMGTQARLLIDQMSQSFIDPLLGLILGGNTSLSEKTLYVQVNSASATFAWGAFIYAVINFIIIAAAIYFMFKWLRLDKLDKKKD
ncbi:MscL family protein [Candidatus Saccharibacteria bacterium]|nr:MscL family protein [Candidatus Saccharibacteria bacterium]